MGRKARKYTAEEEKAMIQMASVGMTFEQIAKAFETNVTTLSKKLGDRLHAAKQKAIGSVLGALYKNAMKGNVAAQIFLAKTQAGFREVDPVLENAQPLKIEFVRGPTRASVKELENQRKNGTSG